MTTLIHEDTNQTLRSRWQTITGLTLALWLGGSLLLDVVVLPCLYSAGMMSQAGFASAGYSLFWAFNRLELLAAALTLTGILVWNYTAPWRSFRLSFDTILGIALLAIVLIETYFLTPQMSALGIQLNQFSTLSLFTPAMEQLQESYWFLEVMKFLACASLLRPLFKVQ